MKKRLLQGISVLWMFVMLFLSHQPGAQSEQLSAVIPSSNTFNPRIAAHVVLYFVFGILLWANRKASNIPVTIALCFCVVFSTFDECTKMFAPGRHCDTQEIVLNIIAACCSFFVLLGKDSLCESTRSS